jgi:predicted CXXCH cytochrome family protein
VRGALVASLAGLAGALTLALEGGAVSRDLETPRDLHRADFVGSNACTRCHPAHAESFERTFHRSMTREASRESVLAPFAGETLTYGDLRARMSTELDARGAPRFVVALSRIRPDGDGEEPLDRAVVARTVGSRRDQQFLAQQDDRYVRLPVAWDIEEARWIHVNEAFLTPDPAGLDEGRVALEDYARHVVTWNDNCIFCHNVGPRPGRDPATGRFSTEVAELGVACEACHGPGSEHVRANASPLRRYALHGGLAGSLVDRPDPTIVHPARLSPERAADVCGRCHGQRITEEIGRFLEAGDPFVPGEDLALYSAPLFLDTTLNGEAVFAPRFWSDGTARLTAYEYQGYAQSRCASEGGLTCNDCHGMHEGDPRGQIRPSVSGDRMCTRCHEALGARDARRAHVRPETPEEARVSGAHARVACIDCHMPRVVYGLRDTHRSHRIDAPRRAAGPRTSDRLDACALCHLDDSHLGRMRPLPAAVEDLFAGDPIQRAVVASALGRLDPRAPEVGFERRARLSLLLEVMRGDRYPGVRSVAWASARGLLSSERTLAPADFSPTGTSRERAAQVEALAVSIDLDLDAPDPRSPGLPSSAERANLRARASARAIEIGE